MLIMLGLMDESIFFADYSNIKHCKQLTSIIGE